MPPIHHFIIVRNRLKAHLGMWRAMSIYADDIASFRDHVPWRAVQRRHAIQVLCDAPASSSLLLRLDEPPVQCHCVCNFVSSNGRLYLHVKPSLMDTAEVDAARQRRFYRWVFTYTLESLVFSMGLYLEHNNITEKAGPRAMMIGAEIEHLIIYDMI